MATQKTENPQSVGITTFQGFTYFIYIIGSCVRLKLNSVISTIMSSSNPLNSPIFIKNGVKVESKLKCFKMILLFF